MSEKISEKGLLKIEIEIFGWKIGVKEVCDGVGHQFYSSIILIIYINYINWDGV